MIPGFQGFLDWNVTLPQQPSNETYSETNLMFPLALVLSYQLQNDDGFTWSIWTVDGIQSPSQESTNYLRSVLLNFTVPSRAPNRYPCLVPMNTMLWNRYGICLTVALRDHREFQWVVERYAVVFLTVRSQSTSTFFKRIQIYHLQVNGT